MSLTLIQMLHYVYKLIRGVGNGHDEFRAKWGLE